MTTDSGTPEHQTSAQGRFDPRLAYRAAHMYYLENATQADIAGKLAVSRPTVSRLIAEARRIGLVHIEVRDPDSLGARSDDRSAELAERLGLSAVHLVPGDQRGREGAGLAGGVTRALAGAGLRPADTLLVSSGRTVAELARNPPAVPPGLQIAPSVGGVAEPEAWYQTNEIARTFAENTLGRARFLFATALPTPAMRATLDEDPDFVRVTGMWGTAKAALVGIGAPTSSRSSISLHIPAEADQLLSAVGDICLNFFDYDGKPVEFDGSDRIVRISPEQLRAIPTTIAVAVGAEKIVSIVAGARTGMFDELVTDVATATGLLAELDRQRP